MPDLHARCSLVDQPPRERPSALLAAMRNRVYECYACLPMTLNLADIVLTYPVGEGDMDGAARVVVGLHAAGGAVDELVGDDDGAGPVLGLQGADRAGGQDLAHPERTQRPQVGAVGDA